MKNNTTDSPRVNAARKLANSLQDDLDFAMYLDSHPNEENALNRLWRDIQNAPEREAA